MQKSIFLLTLGALMLAACGGPAATARPEAVGDGAVAPTTAPATAAQVALSTLAPTVAAPTETVVREIKSDFVATDPSTVQLAAGKPQLVEFYAVW